MKKASLRPTCLLPELHRHVDSQVEALHSDVITAVVEGATSERHVVVSILAQR